MAKVKLGRHAIRNLEKQSEPVAFAPQHVASTNPAWQKGHQKLEFVAVYHSSLCRISGAHSEKGEIYAQT
jgi:hypothetical protein